MEYSFRLQHSAWLSGLERVLHQNGVLALGAGRQQRDRTAHQFLDAAHVLDRLCRQLRPGPRPRSLRLPALDGLVDRLDLSLGVPARRQIVDIPTIEAVSHTNLKFSQTIKDVELGQSQAVDAAGTHGLPYKYGVEPTAAPRPTGHGAEFAPAFPEQAPDLAPERQRIGQIHDADGAPTDLVLIGRADAAPGGADAREHIRGFANRVEFLVQRQD